jgi:hypothetical protein
MSVLASKNFIKFGSSISSVYDYASKLILFVCVDNLLGEDGV